MTSKLRNFIRDVNRECDTLPPNCHARRIRMNYEMFSRLWIECDKGGWDITKSSWGNPLPKGYDGFIADLPIKIDQSCVDGAVDLDYDCDDCGRMDD